jgi:hypothetical protein
LLGYRLSRPRAYTQNHNQRISACGEAELVEEKVMSIFPYPPKEEALTDEGT